MHVFCQKIMECVFFNKIDEFKIIVFEKEKQINIVSNFKD